MAIAIEVQTVGSLHVMFMTAKFLQLWKSFVHTDLAVYLSSTSTSKYPVSRPQKLPFWGFTKSSSLFLRSIYVTFWMPFIRPSSTWCVKYYCTCGCGMWIAWVLCWAGNSCKQSTSSLHTTLLCHFPDGFVPVEFFGTHMGKGDTIWHATTSAK